MGRTVRRQVHIITSRYETPGDHYIECSCGRTFGASTRQRTELAYNKHILAVVRATQRPAVPAGEQLVGEWF